MARKILFRLDREMKKKTRMKTVFSYNPRLNMKTVDVRRYKMEKRSKYSHSRCCKHFIFVPNLISVLLMD